VRALDIDPVHDTRKTFRSLVNAMSRPGTVQTGPTTPMDHAVISTLVDHEVGIRTDDEELRDALAAEGRLTDASFDEADIVHVRGNTDERIRDVRRGTLKEPSRGGTVVYRVEELDGEMDVDVVEEVERDTVDSLPTKRQSIDYQLLELSGPGVPGTRVLGVAGIGAPEIDAIADAQSAFPRGVDVVLTTKRQVAALPRSISLEVA